MEDPESAPAATPAVRAGVWAALFGGAGVVLLVLVLLTGFAVVLLLMGLFLRLVGEPVGLHRLYDGGGDTVLHRLLGGHLALLGGAAVVSVALSWLVLVLLRRWQEVRGWWPSAQGVLAAAAAYALLGVAALAIVLMRGLG